MKIPISIAKGDSVTWKDNSTRDNLGNTLSAPDWTLKYALRGPTVLDLTAVQDGTGWSTSITAAQSGAFTAGVYYWQSYVEKGSERVTVGSGQLKVTENLVTATAGFDGKTQAETDLAAVQAAMRAMISGGAVQEYAIGGRSVKRMAMADLIALESRLKTIVVREKKASMIENGLGNPHTLKVRF